METERHVVLWRMGAEKLGLQLAVADNTLKISAITGRCIEAMNRRCRSCRVKQILDYQLLVDDQVVCVNGKRELFDMFKELSNVEVECLHVRVRRRFALGCPLVVQVIKNYDTRREPQTGYLSVCEGTMVTLQPGSRAPPEAGNSFRCDYIFAWTDLCQGWLPVDILSVRHL